MYAYIFLVKITRIFSFLIDMSVSIVPRSIIKKSKGWKVST